MRFTEHFTFEELTRTDDIDLKEKNIVEGLRIQTKLEKLAKFAEQVRAIIGCPMIITSGFRCEELNKKVGGSAMSQHRFGEAIDFIPSSISAFEAFAKIIISNIEYGQLILEGRGIGHILHISMGTKRQKLYQAKAGGKYENIL